MSRSWLRVVLFAVGFVGGAVPIAVVDADDWAVESGDERQREIIARYKTMLENNPVEGMALQRLLGYVGRGPGLDGLVAEYQRRLQRDPQALNLQLVLGLLLAARGDYEEARLVYDRAIELDASSAQGWLGRGKARLLLGERLEAMADFEEALTREGDRERRREILQQLGELSFAQREFERGKEFYQRLVAERPRDEFLRMDYVRLLVQYRQFEEALEQYGALLRLAGGDTRQRATLLREKADVYEMMDRRDEAIATYEQALGLVSASSWVAREVRQELVNVYRRSGALQEFAEEYGARWARGAPDQQLLIADVYTEMGELEQALTIYRRIAAGDSRAVEPRQKIIRLLERMGQEEEIPAAYQALIRAAPTRQQFGFDLADYHIRSGDRQAAEQALDAVERRFRSDSYILLEVAAHFARWGFDQKARRTYDEVLRREPGDDAVIIEVGDFYFDEGQRQRAIEIWSTLPASRLGDYAGRVRLAEIFVERGIMTQGLAVFEDLLEESPDDERLLRAAARALERVRRFEDALEPWQRLLRVTTERQRRQEARARIVELHQRLNSLQAELRRWRETFEADDDDEAINAGFFMAEAYLRLRDFEAAQTTLRALDGVETLSKEDRVMALLLLEQAYVRNGNYQEAIDTLEQLAEVSPEVERELLDRMAAHSLQAHAGDQAVSYALRALDANPDDARAQARIADIYRGAGDLEAAAHHYRTAIEIDHRAHATRLKLGELLVELGRYNEAQAALTAVVTDADEDQLVLDAGQILLDMAKANDRLAALEAQWSPLVFRLPIRQVHARLMLDLYYIQVGPLLLDLYHGMASDREAARQRLFAAGGRATALLVEQLRGRDQSQRGRALRLVAEMEVDLATPSIARLIVDEDERMAKMAIVAAARLGSADFVEPLEQVLADATAQTRHLVIWALGHIDSPRADALLTQLASEGVEGIAARLAWMGLYDVKSADVEDLLVRRLHEGGASANAREMTRSLTMVLARIRDGQGRVFQDALEALAQSRSDKVGTMAAQSLGAYGDAAAAAFLWRLTLSENDLRARRGEAGLRELVMATELPEPSAVDEARFFNWTRVEFDAEGLLEATDRRRQTVPAEDFHNAPWPPAMETGLRQALRDENLLGEVLSPELLSRIGADLRAERATAFWSPAAVQTMARVALDAADSGELGAEERLLLEAIGGNEIPPERIAAFEDRSLSAALELIVAAENLPATTARELIFEALDRDSPPLRRDAFVAATALDPSAVDTRFVDVVLATLEQGDGVSRAAAVQAAGHLGIVQARPLLSSLEPGAAPSLRRALRQAQRALDTVTAEP